MGFLLGSWLEMMAKGEEYHGLSSKEIVPYAVVSKEDYVDSFLGHERTQYNLFIAV